MSAFPSGLCRRLRLRVLLYDTNTEAVERVSRGQMPFEERGAQDVLQEVVGRSLTATSDPASISTAEHIIVVIGTPVDEHLNPDPTVVSTAVETVAIPGDRPAHRPTIDDLSGSTAVVERTLQRLGIDVEVAFCPERIAEGRAIRRTERIASDRVGTQRNGVHAS